MKAFNEFLSNKYELAEEVGDELSSLWQKHGEAHASLDYLHNAGKEYPASRKEKYEKMKNDAEEQVKSTYGPDKLKAMKDHSDHMSDLWNGRRFDHKVEGLPHEGQLKDRISAQALREKHGITWNGNDKMLKTDIAAFAKKRKN